MVIASLEIHKSEEELRNLRHCFSVGTEAFQLMEAARALGLSRTRKYNLNFDELKSELERGIYPIVYLNMHLSANIPAQLHSVVVVAINEGRVQVLDPLLGERTITGDEFFQAWSLARRLTILVE